MLYFKISVYHKEVIVAPCFYPC